MKIIITLPSIEQVPTKHNGIQEIAVPASISVFDGRKITSDERSFILQAATSVAYMDLPEDPSVEKVTTTEVTTT